MIEVLLRYIGKETPKPLTLAWGIRRAAYIPIVLPAEGVYPLLTVAVVDINAAHPNVMPVVTATCPRTLNLVQQSTFGAFTTAETIGCL